MLDALIFDFDGVVVDSEPVHLRCFQRVLEKTGIPLTSDEYYTKYLGFDDHDCFQTVLRDKGHKADERQIQQMIAEKTLAVQGEFTHSIRALPGAVELAAAARKAQIPTSVCSGALRKEIELAAKTVGAWPHFLAIVSAEDVRHGKPDPEGYRLALATLTKLTGKPLRADKTVAIEDSPAGIASAAAVGMKVLAVTTSYKADALRQANRIVHSLAEVTIQSLEEL